MTPLDRITERVCRLGHPEDPDTPRPLVSVAEFFEGNNEVGSIGCNLLSQPTPADFHRLFLEILSRQQVADIRVQITMFDVPEWPFSDTVYVITKASPEEVRSWFPESLSPDETWLGFAVGQEYEPYEVPEGFHVVAAWWD
jgi:hypothetical protein